MVPPHPKLFHIVHVDRLPSIIGEGCVWCDAEVVRRNPEGTPLCRRGGFGCRAFPRQLTGRKLPAQKAIRRRVTFRRTTRRASFDTAALV